MNTKIRTAIITLIAACSFATATIAPTVAQAQKTNNALKKKKCDDLETEYWRWTQIVEQDVAEGRLDQAAQDAPIVTTYLNEGQVNGCSWAAAVGPAEPTGPVKEGKAPVKEIVAPTPPVTAPPVVKKTTPVTVVTSTLG